ncbi:MAG: V4R domain-containing protein [Candidatus Micrarchaeales archaeon]
MQKFIYLKVEILSGFFMAKKTIKASQSTKTKKVAQNRKAAKPVSIQPINSEEFLIKGLSSSRKHIAASSHILPELLYNITPSTKSLGYNRGFQIGLRLCVNHNKANNITPLINALENAGFRHILYHPHKNNVIIEAHHHPEHEIGAPKDMHVFEAGLIAGYLTQSTGMEMNGVENQCVHRGGNMCQFLIELNPDIRRIESFEGMDQISEVMRSTLLKKRMEREISENYFALQMLPFTEGPLHIEVSKLLYVLGERVGLNFKINEQTMEKLSTLFCLKEIKIIKEKKRVRGIRIDYKHNLSTAAYTDLVSAFLTGMIFSIYNRTPKPSRRLNGSGTYTVELAI